MAVTDIWNKALSHLGSGKEIASIDEPSDEARACRRFWDTAIKDSLREFSWPIAKRFVTGGLVATAPTTEWAYSYRYPADCLYFRRILSGLRTDTESSRIPYLLGGDDQGQLIYTDQSSAQFEYTTFVDNVDRFPHDHQMALSWMLAFYIAPRVAGQDPFKMGERAMQMYQVEIGKAINKAVGEERPDNDPASSFERARG